MNLAKKTTLATSVMLAMALTLSCSSDDDKESVGSSFNENSQIYKPDGTALSSNGVIKMRFIKDDKDICENEINVGSVTNGVVTLSSTLPTPSDECLEFLGDAPSGCSAWPSDLNSADAKFMLYEGEDYKGELRMIYFEGNTFRETIKYAYGTKNASIICNIDNMDFNMSVKPGWNKIYEQIKQATSGGWEIKNNTNSNILTHEVQWTLL